MNWLTVVMVGVFVLCSLNWFYNSQYTFKGPRRHDSICVDATKNSMNADDSFGVERQLNPMVEPGI